MRTFERPENNRDRSSWPAAGGLFVGIGAGLVLMEYNPMALAGLAVAGLGAGLIISAVLSQKDRSGSRD